jgi:hypothetical protein
MRDAWYSRSGEHSESGSSNRTTSAQPSQARCMFTFFQCPPDVMPTNIRPPTVALCTVTHKYPAWTGHEYVFLPGCNRTHPVQSGPLAAAVPGQPPVVLLVLQHGTVPSHTDAQTIHCHLMTNHTILLEPLPKTRANSNCLPTCWLCR